MAELQIMKYWAKVHYVLIAVMLLFFCRLKYFRCIDCK
jgi:hypothetical protein